MLKKTIRRLGALAMVLAMAVSVFAVNASAAVTNPKITKTVNAANNVKAPATSFNFTIANVVAAEDANGVVATLDDGTPVYEGETGGVTFMDGSTTGTITFDAESALSKSADLKFDTTKFPRPGVYAYTISEVVPADADKYDGMSYAPQTKTLYVYVVNGTNGGLVVDGCEFLNETSKGDGVFTNTYTTNNLKVIKKITGTQGVQGDKFSFQVTVNGADGEKYTMTIPDGNGGTTTVTLTSGEASAVFELSGDQSAMIYGLSANDTFTVTETTANSAGYKTTYGVADGITNGDATVTGTATISGEKMGTTDKTATVRNDKSPSTPTGVIMTIAPYALMVVLAGAFAVVFLSRRNRAE